MSESYARRILNPITAKQQACDCHEENSAKGNDGQEFRGGSRRVVLTVASNLILRRSQEIPFQVEG